MVVCFVDVRKKIQTKFAYVAGIERRLIASFGNVLPGLSSVLCL